MGREKLWPSGPKAEVDLALRAEKRRANITSLALEPSMES